MLRIGICDDEEVICDYIEFLIKEYAEKNDLRILVKKFCSGTEFLDVNEYFDIVFMDVVMPEINGIEVGKVLRDKNQKVKIVYISGYKEYAVDAFEVQASFFLIKPLNKSKFFSVLDEIIELIEVEKKKAMIRIKKFTIRADEVIYVKGTKNHRVIVCTRSESIDVRGELKDIVNEIESFGFINPRRGIWINFTYLQKKEAGNIYMDGGEVIKIAKNRDF